MSTDRELGDPWRYRCPKGHAAINTIQGPHIRAHGQRQVKHIETQNGSKYRGRFYCQTCNTSYHEIIDAKTGCRISGRTPA